MLNMVGGDSASFGTFGDIAALDGTPPVRLNVAGEWERVPRHPWWKHLVDIGQYILLPDDEDNLQLYWGTLGRTMLLALDPMRPIMDYIRFGVSGSNQLKLQGNSLLPPVSYESTQASFYDLDMKRYTKESSNNVKIATRTVTSTDAVVSTARSSSIDAGLRNPDLSTRVLQREPGNRSSLITFVGEVKGTCASAHFEQRTKQCIGQSISHLASANHIYGTWLGAVIANDMFSRMVVLGKLDVLFPARAFVEYQHRFSAGSSPFVIAIEAESPGHWNRLNDLLIEKTLRDQLAHSLMVRKPNGQLDINAGFVFDPQAVNIAWRMLHVSFQLALRLPLLQPFERLPSPTAEFINLAQSLLAASTIGHETADSNNESDIDAESAACGTESGHSEHDTENCPPVPEWVEEWRYEVCGQPEEGTVSHPPERDIVVLLVSPNDMERLIAARMEASPHTALPQ